MVYIYNINYQALNLGRVHIKDMPTTKEMISAMWIQRQNTLFERGTFEKDMGEIILLPCTNSNAESHHAPIKVHTEITMRMVTRAIENRNLLSWGSLDVI